MQNKSVTIFQGEPNANPKKVSTNSSVAVEFQSTPFRVNKCNCVDKTSIILGYFAGSPSP